MATKVKARHKGFLGEISDVLVQFFSNFFNGIFYETRLKIDLPRAYDDLTDVKYLHFLEIISQQPRTRVIKDYVDLLADEAAWTAFEQGQMDQYFHDKIDLFPYNREDSSRGSAGLGLNKPDDFFRIQMDMIRRRFPGGDGRDIGDNDIRRLISCLRYVFRFNFKSLILWRRVWALLIVVYSLATSLFLTGSSYVLQTYMVGAPDWVYVSYATVVLTFAMIFAGFAWWVMLFKYKSLSDHYSETVRHSCSVLGRALEMRIQNIIATIPLIFNEVEKSRFNYDNQTVREQWPQEVKKWSKLAFWMAARVEHMEFFLQAQMWRIRRIHFGFKAFAVVASWGITLLALGGAALTVWLAVLHIAPHLPELAPPYDAKALMGVLPVIYALATHILCAGIAVGSYTSKIPDLDLIERTIQTDKMPRNHDVKLYEEVATFLYREKKALLNEEDKLSGKKS